MAQLPLRRYPCSRSTHAMQPLQSWAPQVQICELFKHSHCQAVDKLFAEQKFDGIIHFAGLKVVHFLLVVAFTDNCWEEQALKFP